jgi:hypothetical protein
MTNILQQLREAVTPDVERIASKYKNSDPITRFCLDHGIDTTFLHDASSREVIARVARASAAAFVSDTCHRRAERDPVLYGALRAIRLSEAGWVETTYEKYS